jgi:hypothetical protein
MVVRSNPATVKSGSFFRKNVYMPKMARPSLVRLKSVNSMVRRVHRKLALETHGSKNKFVNFVSLMHLI